MLYPIDESLNLGSSTSTIIGLCVISLIATAFLFIYAVRNFRPNVQGKIRCVPQLFVIGNLALSTGIVSLWIITNFTAATSLNFTGCLLFNIIFIYFRTCSSSWSFTLILVLHELRCNSRKWFHTEERKWKFCKYTTLIILISSLVPCSIYIIVLNFWIDSSRTMAEDNGIGSSMCTFEYSSPNEAQSNQSTALLLSVAFVDFLPYVTSIIGIILLIHVWRSAHLAGDFTVLSLCQKLSGYAILSFTTYTFNFIFWCLVLRSSTNDTAMGKVYNYLIGLQGLIEVLIFLAVNRERIKCNCNYFAYSKGGHKDSLKTSLLDNHGL